MTHIELFAGCGGMSLGLDAAGFDLFFANELSPMAATSFSYNLINEDLEELARKQQEAKNVLWIKTKFDTQNLKSRLRENPYKYSEGKYSDLTKKTDIKGKLLVGNINDLLSFLAKNKSICTKLRKENIDLVSGGPPCQSFSLAGRREKDNHKNLLPLSFARLVGLIKPKVALLENVKGITSAFTINSEKYYAWVEVAKAFSLEGYVPICLMVNSKYFGVAQNRPRFILIALRKDVCSKLLKGSKDEKTINILQSALNFFSSVQKNKKSLNLVTKKDLKLYDIEKTPELFDGKLFPQKTNDKNDFITARDAIDDLMVGETSNPGPKSKYVLNLNKKFKSKHISILKEPINHELRNHSLSVKARFRWFQVLNNLNGLSSSGLKLLAGEYVDNLRLKSIFNKIQKEEVLLNDGKDGKSIKIESEQIFLDYIKSIQTKKHSQRALKANEPAPAQLTIPDDLCHYSKDQIRTLTVREMARFQSFPDWFEFKSKVTTGGKQRSFEVPQYTQVGNAVPPLLAYELGRVIKKIIKQAENV